MDPPLLDPKQEPVETGTTGLDFAPQEEEEANEDVAQVVLWVLAAPVDGQRDVVEVVDIIPNSQAQHNINLDSALFHFASVSSNTNNQATLPIQLLQIN